jgi:pyridoxal phosphate enzyme (YggS family)
MNIIENFLNIKKEIEALNYKTNLIVVSKNQSLENIIPLIETGHCDFGENRIQEAANKWTDIISNNKDINLHLLGKLQSNKAKEAYKIFNYIHSLDNEKLAKIFSDLEFKHNKKLKYFIQVNIGNENQKNGIDKKLVTNFLNYCKIELKLNIIGLMCIPPMHENAKKFFLELKKMSVINNLSELSMGMSEDFKEAINCGATYIRIGSAIFGKRSN